MFYSEEVSQKENMRTALLFIPHQDDELLVGGGLLYALANTDGWNVKVVYSTNGDYYRHEAFIRLQEAIDANKMLGIPEENVFFLGYGDRWRGKHLYNSTTACVSMAGYSQTYALKSHPEYYFKKSGRHHEYTRENLKQDIKSIIRDDFPELLVCVDFDLHSDHRALSFLFTEAIRDILVENPDYTPLILKKLAYENVMRGVKDYFKLPHRKTVNEGNDLKSTPILKWEDRLSFEMPEICNQLRLSKNPLYLAACCYKSQNIQYRMINAINSDIIYWRIPSENLSLIADITVSSGQAFFLNDLKKIDSNDIRERKCSLDAAVWMPDKDDREKKITYRWNKEQKISQIEFFENPNRDCNIYKILIVLDNKKQYLFLDINHDGSASVLKFEEPIKTYSLEIKILEGTMCAGFSEIAIYDLVTPVEKYMLPCRLVKEGINIRVTLKDRLISLYDYAVFSVQAFLRKVWATEYVLMRHYPKTIGKKSLMPIYRIYHFFRRFFLFIKGKGKLPNESITYNGL